MKIRPSVQAVIFDEKEKKFLLIKKFDIDLEKFCWRLVKGGIEEGESEIDAIRREVFEEVGLKNIEIGEKLYSYDYTWRDLKVMVAAYLVKADVEEKVTPQGKTEHETAIVDYVWVPEKEALEKVQWGTEKKAITICLSGVK